MLNARKFAIESIFPAYLLCAGFYMDILDGNREEIKSISVYVFYVFYAYMAYSIFGPKNAVGAKNSTITRRGLLDAFWAAPFFLVAAGFALFILVVFVGVVSEGMSHLSNFLKFAIYAIAVLGYWYYLYKCNQRKN